MLMSLPPETDQRIRETLQELESEAERLSAALLQRPSRFISDLLAEMDLSHVPADDPYERDFYTLRDRFVNVIRLLSNRQNTLGKLADRVAKVMPGDIEQLRGSTRALKVDYEAGMLMTLSQLIEANVAADYLGQAESLLQQGKSGQYDHVPAAVLVGAILEDGLRRLCQRQNPPIQVKVGKGYKKLNTMIDDLRKAGLYNELKAKQLRAWADIRNAAAHGRFDDFGRADVEQMLAGVQQFLGNYL